MARDSNPLPHRLKQDPAYVESIKGLKHRKQRVVTRPWEVRGPKFLLPHNIFKSFKLMNQSYPSVHIISGELEKKLTLHYLIFVIGLGVVRRLAPH